MSKKTRIKADPLVIGDLARAESALMELADLHRKVQGITADLNSAIDTLKENAKQEVAPLEARMKALSDALGTFGKMHYAELFGEKKSQDLAFGVIGFRASTALIQMKGITAAMSLQRLKEHGLHEGIRIREELDKDVMRGWPSERLALVGLVRQQKEQFYVELKEERLGTDAA